MCAVMDHAEQGEICEPWKAVYNTQGLTLSNDFNVYCRLLPDPCDQKACLVESYFASRAAELAFKVDGTSTTVLDPLNAGYLRSDAGFDQKAMCETAKAAHTSMGFRKCCGTYPSRFPFRPLMKECCADGRIAMRGTC